MALRVNTNIAAINARRHLNNNTRVLSLKQERLSSGLRLNRASDDAAGLSVREGMRAEISGLKATITNAEQASNLLQTAEGSLNEVNGILVRMRELAAQSGNSTFTDSNREALQGEFGQLAGEIDRIASATTYNNQTLLTGYGNRVDGTSTTITASDTSGVTEITISGAQTGTYTFEDTNNDSTITLGNGTVSQTINIGQILDGAVIATGTQFVANFDRLGVQVTLAGAEVGSATGSYTDGDLNGQTLIVSAGTGGSFQVGPTDRAFNRLEVSIADMKATGTTLNLSSASIATITTARTAITSIDQAIGEVAKQRGTLGAFQNRLSFAVGYTENEVENITASESAISDADIAGEVSDFTRSQILSQAATAMLAQANVLPQNALALLR
jgi:flagellin